MTFLSLELSVHLMRALAKQKQSTEKQNQITAGNFLSQDVEERSGKSYDPCDREQEKNSNEHCEAESKTPGFLTLFGGQLAGKNGNEYDIVDAKNDLECSESGERNPGLGVGDPIHSVRSYGKDYLKIPKCPRMYH